MTRTKEDSDELADEDCSPGAIHQSFGNKRTVHTSPPHPGPNFHCNAKNFDIVRT